MEKLEQYGDLVKKILSQMETWYNSGIPAELEDHAIFDDQRGRYILFRNGWWEDHPVRSATVYVRLHNDKIWIEEDHTEEGFATYLLEAGVPKSSIVLAFQHPDMRPLTEFAVI